MDAARNFLASPATFSLRTHFKNCPFYASSSSSSSVLMLHDQVAPAPTSTLTSSLSRHLYAPVPVQDQPSHSIMEDETLDATMERKLMITSFLPNEEKDSHNWPGESNGNCSVQLLHLPGLWYLFPSSEIIHSGRHTPGEISDDELGNVVDLARKALAASRVATVLAEQSKMLATDPDTSLSVSMLPSTLTHLPLEEESSMKSMGLLKRRSKRRRLPKPKVMDEEKNHPQRMNLQRKRSSAVSDPNDQLWSFVDLKTKLLTANEEAGLIVKIQDGMKLEEVKSRLNIQFGREPTLVEWGKAVGLSPQELQSQLRMRTVTREKLIHANYRLVVHVAKKYQGHGLNLQDLLQEGSMGLMKSIEKFKAQAGCRFATYAYWWVRQAISKAIFQHSRTIRLPDNVYGLLSKVKEAKRICIQQGRRYPTKEDIALCAGMSIEKLDKLLSNARMPLSMQQSVWNDQDAIFQEVTADTAIEATNISVEKQLMRRHTRNLLGVLDPKERKIIRLRFGIENGEPKSLSEIGDVFGLTNERVRQLESRALYKLKQCLDNQGLKAYEGLLL